MHHCFRFYIKHLGSGSSQPDRSGMQWLSQEAALVLGVVHGSWLWSRGGRRRWPKIVEWATTYCASLFQVSHRKSKCSIIVPGFTSRIQMQQHDSSCCLALSGMKWFYQEAALVLGVARLSRGHAKILWLFLSKVKSTGFWRKSLLLEV